MARPKKPTKQKNAKRDAFVREYLKDHNGAQAAIRAGYAPGATARVTASRLLADANVQAAIAAAQAKRAERLDVDVDRIVKEYAKLAFSNIADYLDFSPTSVKLKRSDQLSPAALAAVLEVSEHKSEAGTSVRFKLHSKTSALEALGRHLGMFNDKLDVKLQGAVEELLAGVRSRISSEAYAELIRAVQAEMGLPDLAPTAAGTGGQATGGDLH